MKLRLVKTWWVRWPGFISVLHINRRRRASGVKSTEALSGWVQHRLNSRLNYLWEPNQTVVFIKSEPKHILRILWSPYTHRWDCPCQHLLFFFISFFYTCRKELCEKATATIHGAFPTTYSFTELFWESAQTKVHRRRCISESKTLFFFFLGVSLAHLFDPKHSALSPPEGFSGTLGRNQDVILNWLKRKVFMDRYFLFFYIFLSIALLPFSTELSLISSLPQQAVPLRTAV